MNVENNHTAETEREQTKNGNETITIQTTLGDEGKSSAELKPSWNIYLTLCLGLANFHRETLLAASCR